MLPNNNGPLEDERTEPRILEGKRISRRDFLKFAGLAGATVGVGAGLGGFLAACGSSTTTTTAASTTTTAASTTTTAASTGTTAASTGTTAASTGTSAATQRFDGVTLNMSMLDWPPTTALRAITPEFEQLTGVKTTYDVLPWQQSHDKLTLELAAGHATYDVITLDNVWTAEFIRGKFLEALPVDQWKADAQFNYADIFPNYITYENEPFGAGTTYVLPFATDVYALLYRTDLFGDSQQQAAFKQKYGYDLAPPTTWDQYRDAAIFFTQPPIYGTGLLAGRGQPIASDFTQYLYGRGGQILNGKGQPIFNSPEGVAALDFYKALLNTDKVASPDSINWGNDEVIGAMQQGHLAMVPMWISFLVQMTDPKNSTVAGKVGISPMPKLASMPKPNPGLGGWGMSVPAFSKNKEAALAYVNWFMLPDTQKKYALAGGPPDRVSVYYDSDVDAKFTYYKAFGDNLKYGIPLISPVVPVYTEMESVLGIELQKALLGQESSQAALDSAAAQITTLIKNAGYLQS